MIRSLQILLLLALQLTSVVGRADTLSRAEQGQVYDEAVHILGGNANVIARWVDEIRYAIVGADEATSMAAVTAQDTLADIAEQTGLTARQIRHEYVDAQDYLDAFSQITPYHLMPCKERGHAECANFVILFSDTGTMEKLAKAIPLRSVYQQAFNKPDQVHCFFAPFQTSRMEIAQAFVYVRKDLSEPMIRTCLHEEIYQSFGLFNDFSDSLYFSFNNKVEPKSITRYDRALLQAVYDPRFKPGAPVFAVVKRLMDNLEFDPLGR